MSRIPSYPGGARRTRRPGRAGAAAATPASVPSAAAERLEGRLLLATFTVTTTADDGPGSLRQAILDANASPNAAGAQDTISFNIPGTGVRSIRPLSPLPAVNGPVVIDGATQPGYPTLPPRGPQQPLIEIDGSNAGAATDGLTFTAGSVTVQALTVNRFGGHGIVLRGNSYTQVYRCFIGTDATGNGPAGNGAAGILVSSRATIGGFSGAWRANVISANGYAGIWMTWMYGDASMSAVEGNHVGTYAIGTEALGNGREGLFVDNVTMPTIRHNLISGNASSGIRLLGDHGPSSTIQYNSIGVDSSGTRAIPNGSSAASPYRDGVTVIARNRPTIESNLISGNHGNGISVAGGGGVVVQHNRVGVNATGTAAIGNTGTGILVERASGARVLGNRVAGNGGDGIRIAHCTTGSEPNAVGANYVGVDAAGDNALANGGNGIVVHQSREFTIGGGGYFPPVGWPFPTIQNNASVISGNRGHGIVVTATDRSSTNHWIWGNVIGTNDAGRAALPNGGSGILIASSGNRVGHLNPALGNVISGNLENGITIVDAGGQGSRSNVVYGNYIGTAPVDPGQPQPVLGNRGHGVAIYNSSMNRIADPPAAGATSRNRISFNGGSGIWMEGPAFGDLAAIGNTISGNFIHSNSGLGIDLASPSAGVTPNDPGDVDQGPNGLQNFPIITAAEANEVETLVRFTLNARPNSTYLVEFFTSRAPDPSGHGEGETYLARTSVTTDGAGDASGSMSLRRMEPGEWVTATATGAETSEFSAAKVVTGQGVVGRHVFYNNSAFDGWDPAANAADDNAISTTLKPLRQNRPMPAYVAPALTSNPRGLNGLMVDIVDGFAGVEPSADDFVFRVGNDQNPAGWAAGPSPSQVTIRRGAGIAGSDRITLAWPDGAITNTWLQVTVKPGERTGLAAAETFYFGSLVGETSNNLSVDSRDLNVVRRAIGRTGVSVDEPPDVNRDGSVTPRDYAIVRANLGRVVLDLRPWGMPVPITPQPLEAARVWDEESPAVLSR